ncbi:MAG: YkgJ family cysteine cluster protein [Bacteroidales bacterium]
MCGRCCRNMRGRTYRKHKTLPYIFMFTPPSLKTIGLFEWELPVLELHAKKLAIPLRIKPDNVIWDQNSKNAIVITWNLDHDDCPFMSDKNKCRIYDYRPLVCQTYPLMAVGLLQYITERHGGPFEIGLADCPNCAKLPFQEGTPLSCRPSSLFSTLFKVYGSTFLGALRFDGASIIIFEHLEQAVEKGIIRPAIVDKNVIKAILRSAPVGLFEFLQSEGVIDKKDIEKEIQSIYNFTIRDLKKIIKGR